ncbi:hypothetical protein ACROYT_G025670 [Oculina patagonica]
MVDTTEIEEIQLTLEAKICAMDMDMLMGLAVKLKVAVEGLRKLQLSKKIRERIETDVEECEGSEAKKQCLEGFVEMVEGPPPLEGELHHEGLSFVSLVRQIDGAVKLGYSESEVVEAVIRAVSPALKLRPLLEKANVSDEELMERINTAVSAETERLNKVGSKKSPQVSHVDAQSTDTDQGATSKDRPASKEAKPNKLVAILEAVQSDLASLREEFRKSQVTAREW